ncbi:MAG: hypothetical protein HKM07_04085, partial [Chlamydiae bacterium]|nr:hypothetical protein [Chlamydiota bacterium]
ELALTCRDFAFLEKVYTDSQIAEKTNSETYVQVLSAIKMGARIESAADPETGLDNAKRIFAKAKAEEKATVELYNLMIQIAGIYGEIEYAKELFEETKQTATCETYEAILFSAGINQDRNYANHTFLAGQRAYGKLVPAMIHTCSIIGALDAAERKFLQSLHQKSIARGREMSLEHVKEQYKTKDTPPTLLIPETIEAWDYAKRIYSSLDKKTQSGDKFIPVETCVSFILFGGEIADFSFAKQVFEKARSVKLAAPELFSALIETATRCKTPEATSYAKDVFAQAKGENVHALVYDKMIDLAAADGDVRLVRELVAEAKGRGFLTRNVCDAYISCLVQHDLLTEALKAFEDMNFSFSRENRGTPFEIVIQTEKTGTPSIDLNGFSIGTAIAATLKFFEKQKSENQPTDKLIIKLGDIRGISNLQSHLDPRYPVRTVFMDLFHALFDPVEGNPNKIAYPNLQATQLPGYARNVSKILFKNTEITKTKTT